MSISELAYKMVKNKDSAEEIKRLEKQIKSWEKEKSYPSLDDIYQLAYVININPGELLTFRNRGRKQFYKETAEQKIRKHDWVEISENASLIFSSAGKLFIVFAFFIFCIALYKFVDTYFGETGGIVVDQVITRDIQNHTGQENQIINDGTVSNMVKRIKKEEKNRNSGENLIENNVFDEN